MVQGVVEKDIRDKERERDKGRKSEEGGGGKSFTRK
jgi:hypothetical protein